MCKLPETRQLRHVENNDEITLTQFRQGLNEIDRPTDSQLIQLHEELLHNADTAFLAAFYWQLALWGVEMYVIRSIMQRRRAFGNI
jgi:hypothetical protein